MNAKTKQGSKFELVDHDATSAAPPVVTRTVAERASREKTRTRREFNGTVKHFQLDPRVVEELHQEGHLCWINDDLKGHLEEMEKVGYRFVLNREVHGDRQGFDPDAKVCVRYGTANKDNVPQDVYLMLQPTEFYEEDMAARDQANIEIDQQILSNGKEVDGAYGTRVQYSHK